MKFYKSALLALLAVAPSAAFISPLHQHCPAPARATVGLAASAENSETTKVDISVPYDAAARLAYDEWRKEFSKGDFDEKRYLSFKQNYEDISIANVVAKKNAREQGVDSPDLLNLNEFGDFTAEEYEQHQGGGAAPAAAAAAAAEEKAPTTTTELLSQAMEAAQSQSEASEALGDAAKSLEEDEEVGRVSHFITYH
jgi:hypothetical protein